MYMKRIYLCITPTPTLLANQQLGSIFVDEDCLCSSPRTEFGVTASFD